jgi:hypothetical protein
MSDQQMLLAKTKNDQQQVQVLSRDASRWQFMRDHCLKNQTRYDLPHAISRHLDENTKYPTCEELDAAVDAAIASVRA